MGFEHKMFLKHHEGKKKEDWNNFGWNQKGQGEGYGRSEILSEGVFWRKIQGRTQC